MTDAKAVLVCSGKGGTGKTLLSINIAHKLIEKGRKVGLLDSDFSSANIKDFIELPETLMDISGEKFHPVDIDGLKVFSMSLLVGDKAVSMEGTQYSELLRDAVKASEWGNIEYIVVDAPPGFGDIFKRTIDIFPNFIGCILISQPAHAIDLRRAITLCKDLDIRIIGVIENMSYLKVGRGNWQIFGESIVDEIGEEFEIDVLGKIPLCMSIRKLVEAKKPFLTGEMADPVEKAADKILTLQPEKPGFLAKLKEWVKENIDRVLTNIILTINDEIDISGVQEQFTYPGRSIIELNIMKENMRSVISQWHFMVLEGKLVAVEGNPVRDYRIDVWIDAIKWSLLKNRTLSDGSIYDFQSALRMGHMRLWGDRSMARGARFLREVFQKLSENERAIERLRPLLEAL